MKYISGAILLFLSLNSSASILTNLNGIDYEWLELVYTKGLSRDQVEVLLVDEKSLFYGYEYASRELVYDLFNSYAPWDGLNNYHGEPSVVQGVTDLIYDFGITNSEAGDGVGESKMTADGYEVIIDAFDFSGGRYGLTDECRGSEFTCISQAYVFYDLNGDPSAVIQNSQYGWDITHPDPAFIDNAYDHTGYGSFLVKQSVVPIPAAIWLFGTGLLGLIGVARRRANA